jgi:hypothetical protein
MFQMRRGNVYKAFIRIMKDNNDLMAAWCLDLTNLMFKEVREGKSLKTQVSVKLRNTGLREGWVHLSQQMFLESS